MEIDCPFQEVATEGELGQNFKIVRWFYIYENYVIILLDFLGLRFLDGFFVQA